MYLESLKISRFRSFAESTVRLKSDLTVLLGENNGGKSNIIDAIRLATQPLNGRRDRYADDDDIRRGTGDQSFEIATQYDDLSEKMKGLLISAVPIPTENKALIGVRYEASLPTSTRGKFMTWAGQSGVGEPETGSLDSIRHVYLPPLRDAQKALGSSDGVRVMALLRHFLPSDKDEQESILKTFRRASADSHSVFQQMNTDIKSALNSLTDGVRSQTAAIDFASEDFGDLARDLRFRLADSGMNPDDLEFSGLGYANLLYIATVAVELTKAKDADLTIFLVEEPEAHLHPQLQMLMLEYLLEKAKDSAKSVAPLGTPEGRIQVIVTTHSPNLTAWVSPEHLVVVRSVPDLSSRESPSQSVTVSVAEMKIAPKRLNKIRRYLDVTRSALLFGNRAILVEGIAEALLLPAIARHVVLKGNQKQFERFRSTLTTAIDGVDFSPYVEILLRPNAVGARIADHVIVITDGDPSVPGNRKSDLEDLAKTLNASPCLTVFVNNSTLEQELFTATNEVLLKDAFLALHPRSKNDWESKVSALNQNERAAAFLQMIKDKRTSKGDLAQEIADHIADDEQFTAPDYLANAIKEAAKW